MKHRGKAKNEEKGAEGTTGGKIHGDGLWRIVSAANG
jgi:hypothetical protein